MEHSEGRNQDRAMPRRPSVSILLTSFNHEKFLRLSIDTALAQSFTDFELVIYDDGSSDSSCDIIRSYGDPRIRFLQNVDESSGISAFNQILFRELSGEFIAIHHSDDYWHPLKLEKQVSFLAQNQEYGAVFTDVSVVNEDDVVVPSDHYYANVFEPVNRTRPEWLRRFFHRGNCLCHPSILIRRSTLELCGFYNDTLWQVPDFEYWIRLCLLTDIYVLPEKLTNFRILDKNRNTSASTPEVNSAIEFEYLTVLQHFLAIRPEEVFKVFPKAHLLDRGAETMVPYVVARLCLLKQQSCFKLFGLLTLQKLLGDSTLAAKAFSLYGFDYRQFSALVKKHRILGE